MRCYELVTSASFLANTFLMSSIKNERKERNVSIILITNNQQSYHSANVPSTSTHQCISRHHARASPRFPLPNQQAQKQATHGHKWTFVSLPMNHGC
jgi:hypothetical protein